MAVSDDQIAFALELLADLGPVTTRKMFGGVGFYSDGTIFAILMSDGALHLKGAGAMPDRFEAAGWARWTYQRDGAEKPTAMPYWRVPEDVLEDPETACDWARSVLAAL